MLKNKIRFTYRKVYTDRGCMQDVSFYNDKVFADFIESGLTKMTDGENFIPSTKITKEVVPGIKSLRRAGILEYNKALDIEALKTDLLRTTGNFLLEIKTIDEMRAWIGDNTSLVETEKGYLVRDADEMTEEQYLVIE